LHSNESFEAGGQEADFYSDGREELRSYKINLFGLEIKRLMKAWALSVNLWHTICAACYTLDENIYQKEFCHVGEQYL
jgi:hypothetical protein